MCCVRPGVLLVNARREWLASALIALDLPAFERPANAISGGPGGGNCSSSAAVRTNSACCNGCFIEARRHDETLARPSLCRPVRALRCAQPASIAYPKTRLTG